MDADLELLEAHYRQSLAALDAQVTQVRERLAHGSFDLAAAVGANGPQPAPAPHGPDLPPLAASDLESDEPAPPQAGRPLVDFTWEEPQPNANL